MCRHHRLRRSPRPRSRIGRDHLPARDPITQGAPCGDTPCRAFRETPPDRETRERERPHPRAQHRLARGAQREQRAIPGRKGEQQCRRVDSHPAEQPDAERGLELGRPLVEEHLVAAQRHPAWLPRGAAPGAAHVAPLHHRHARRAKVGEQWPGAARIVLGRRGRGLATAAIGLRRVEFRRDDPEAAGRRLRTGARTGARERRGGGRWGCRVSGERGACGGSEGGWAGEGNGCQDDRAERAIDSPRGAEGEAETDGWGRRRIQREGSGGVGGGDRGARGLPAQGWRRLDAGTGDGRGGAAAVGILAARAREDPP
mmetsp:Transcript_20598/g.66722  ORF Transcript_20598/g.66722 Transcript_20598/m.66722 type:complete len:314 (-) Transcript_20598:1091-2032(-)|eukprot:scaffold25503_cov90-Isochrysis_galbana.AAC.2